MKSPWHRRDGEVTPLLDQELQLGQIDTQPASPQTPANTQIQIQKYTNTAYDEVTERPNMCHIFEKRIVQGYQKLYSQVPNEQIQKYKYTNTQIDTQPASPQTPATYQIWWQINLIR